MDISSATWWSEMDIMNMNDLQYIDQGQMMTPFDDLPFNYNNNPFTSCTNYNVQAAGILLEENSRPTFCSSTNATYQTTSFSNSPSASPPQPSSSPSVISFSNSYLPSATTTTAAQNYFENLNTSVKAEVPSGTTINFSTSNISLDSDYDDSQQLFQAMRFGAGDITQTKKISYSRTPLQAQDHVLAERKRRERLTQYFISLSTIIPNLKKLDKASILGDAIKYIKQLEEQVKSLEEQTNKYSEEPVVPVKRARLLSSYDNSNENSNTSTNKSVPDIEVRASDGNVLIRICCKKQARIIKEIFSQVEKLHLTIINTSVISFGCNTTHITIVAQKWLRKISCQGVKALARCLLCMDNCERPPVYHISDDYNNLTRNTTLLNELLHVIGAQNKFRSGRMNPPKQQVTHQIYQQLIRGNIRRGNYCFPAIHQRKHLSISSVCLRVQQHFGSLAQNVEQSEMDATLFGLKVSFEVDS
ncbi:hypothetical protein RND71_011683 [Anisodus tanguticus]|uniref:BHLH domain-containing protein n=1 Tax=Anisodus tanguticus TaxID=243964 RepID=A0AAE1SDV0_9SOLA|nr:hypothetical protein RND71_011683 [Anisodus tanguticus]